MRLRIVTVAVAATLAVTGLAGCRTNVGTAAMVDGHRITESDVNGFLSPAAKPVSEQSTSGTTTSTSPRSFVLEQLIVQRLAGKLLAQTPNGAPSEAKLSAQLAGDLNGRSVKSVAESLGLHGYPTKFYDVVLRVQELSTLIQNVNQSGVDVSALIKKLHFPVSVSPRYGTWDQATFALDGHAAVPSFLKVQPGGTATSAALPAG